MLLTILGGLALLPAVTVASRDVRVADLVAGGAGTAGRLVVLRLADRPGVTRLPAASVAALVRRRVPGIAIDDPAGNVVITRRGAPAVPRRAPCLATARTVAAGAPVVRADTVAVPCTAAIPRALSYDRGGATAFARRALPAGQYLGAVTLDATPAVGRGDSMTLRSVAGPVTVERVVTTMQRARSGGRVFVRDGDGSILSAPLMLAMTR